MKTDPAQLPLPLPGMRAPSAPVFLVGSSNREAFQSVMAPTDWQCHALSLCGPEACGKSTLARLWCHEIDGQFVDAAALATEDVARLGDRPVALDRLEAMADPEAVFHLYNRLGDAGHLLLAVSRLPAGQIETPLRDLRTRLRSMPVARIGQPDEGLIEALLIHLLEEHQLPAGPSVTKYLAVRMERSGLSAVRLVERLDALALAKSRPVSREMAASVLKEIEGSDGE